MSKHGKRHEAAAVVKIGEEMSAPDAPVAELTPPTPEAVVAEADAPEEIVYSFQTRTRCPRCNTVDNKVTHVEGPIRRHLCLRAHCRNAWKEIGTPVA